MKRKGKKKFINLLILYLLILCGLTHSAKAERIDVGIFESETPDKIEIYIKPDFFISGSLTLSGITYTVRWSDPETSISTNFLYPFFVAPQGDPVLHEGYYYQVFASVPTNPIGTDIQAGEERLISSFNITGGSCESFEIIKNNWTANNNADPYFELQGADKTGIIYEPIVHLGSAGGYVSGGGTIIIGESTGTLTLQEYAGDIQKWQKRVDEGTWSDIANTNNTYSETPSSTGTWEYRAVVQNGSCPAESSIAAEVFVVDQSTIWTGSTDSDWFTSGNWTDGVPDATKSATVPNDPELQPEIGDSQQGICDDLTIQDGAKLTISGNGALTVEGDISNPSGISGLKIEAESTCTGSLIHNNTGVEATIERYINCWPSTNPAKGWHFISSPVENQAFMPEFISSCNPFPQNCDLYKWQEDHEEDGITGWWINARTPDCQWNEDFETEFVMGRGYLISYCEEYGNQTKEFKGEINVDNVSKTALTNTPESTNTGWHLLGNPFSCPVKWNQGNWQKNNIGNVPEIWNEESASYVLIDGTDDNYLIPAHNGFMVYTTGNGSITIPSDARVHSNQCWYKTDTTEYFKLIACDTEKDLWQQTTIRENNNATEEFDLEYDAFFIPGYAPLFYSVSGDQNFALNTLPEINESTSVPLNFLKNSSDEFNIELKNAPAETDVFLTDLKLDITQNLSDNPVYNFTAEDGDEPERFLLTFSIVNIEEDEFEQEFSAWFYNNYLFIKNDNSAKYSLMIFNSSGQLIDSKDLTGQILHTYKTTMLPPGMYLGRVINDKKSVTVKFFIN